MSRTRSNAMNSLCAAALASLSLVAPAVARAETLAIENAHLFTEGPQGEIARGTLLIRDGRISAVGAAVAIPKDARRVDAGGRIVTPGFIAVGAPIGVTEGEDIQETVGSGVSGGPLSAGFDLQYGLNPASTLLPIVRLTGTTTAVVAPSLRTQHAENDPRLFAGQAVAIRLDGASDLVIRPKVALVLEAGEDGAKRAGGARSALMVEIKAQLDQARAFAKNPAAFDDAKTHGLTRADLEALRLVVEGKEPLLVSVHREADIRLFLDFARDEKLKLVLIDAEEGWRVAPQIAAQHVSVILNADEDLPYAFEALSSTLENAARLHAAGVSVVIEAASLQTGGKAVRLGAGRASAYGLPYGAAISAVTINAARAFGLAGETGSLEVGKSADVVLWNGDPLDTNGAPALILIRGAEQALTSRQTELRDRYLKAPDGRPPQYRQ